MILPIALPFLVLLFLVLLAVLIVMVELRILAYAYRKIGVRPRYVFAVLVLSLVGSYVNIPLYSVRVPRLVAPEAVTIYGRTYVVPPAIEAGATVVAINVGGALLPILLSLYLFFRLRMYVRMLVGVAVVALIVHKLAYIVPGVGIAVPMLIPPLAAVAVGLLLAFRRAPPVAYVAGSMGTLIGADVMNLGRIAELGAPMVSIGGAGTFDGVFLTGIIAGLLA
ncbi:MAG: hypothetical protein AUH30_16470 [Candidatus Rokubacteria bacterium 13_1_40CM_68_15]|nr:MAG: hypothetical protein AUH30_16470 [Candidatus Rokubacteria bacterium 13_1_40CM_68_15]